MIEISYKKILFLHTFFLVVLAGVLHYAFYKNLTAPFPARYLYLWMGFIVFNLLFLNFFVLPSKRILKRLTSTSPLDMSWSLMEDILSKRDEELKERYEGLKGENTKYKKLLDSLHDPICIFNRDQTILYSNHSYNTLFSLAENGGPPPSLIEASRDLEFQYFVTRAVASDEISTLETFSFHQPSHAHKKFYDIQIFPTKDKSSYVCLMRDITEKKVADLVREDFVSNISHEMRTPLTILSGQMQTLRMDLSKEDSFAQRWQLTFEKIDNNIRRLTNLFSDLLQLNSVEKRKDIKKENIDVSAMIHLLIDELSTTYAHKKFFFDVDLQEPFFFIDYNLFEQAMINLIDNALKYTPDGGRISIRSFSDEKTTSIEVADTGSGIPEDLLHRIFERFFRVDPSRSSAIEGTGLGLSIVKHIVQKHEGKIRVHSKLSLGSTFTLSLPRWS